MELIQPKVLSVAFNKYKWRNCNKVENEGEIIQVTLRSIDIILVRQQSFPNLGEFVGLRKKFLTAREVHEIFSCTRLNFTANFVQAYSSR